MESVSMSTLKLILDKRWCAQKKLLLTKTIANGIHSTTHTSLNNCPILKFKLCRHQNHLAEQTPVEKLPYR